MRAASPSQHFENPMNMSPKLRHRARQFAIQAIYQWQMAGGELADIKTQYIANNDYLKVDWEFFVDIITYVFKESTDLDQIIEPLLSKGASSLRPIERAILRLGIIELKHRIDIPFQVIIHEYVALDFEFGAEEGHKLINSILDKLARKIREVPDAGHDASCDASCQSKVKMSGPGQS